MRFFIGIIIGISFISLGWTSFIYNQLGKATLTSQWVYDAYSKKTEIASAISSNKIVFVGGSNLLFGINSKAIETHFNIPTVNYGVNAGLLLPYTLYAAKRVLKKGDFAVLALEYPMFTYDGKQNEQIIDYTYSRDVSFFNELHPREKFILLFETTLDRIIKGYKETGGKPILWGTYGIHNIDDHGDQIHTSKKEMTPSDHDAVSKLKPMFYGKEFKNSSSSWSYLKKFQHWAKANGVHTVFIPSVFLDNQLYHTEKTERYFYTHLPAHAREIGLDYIGDPYDFMYPKEAFFNTDYHLNNEYRNLHTQKVIHLLNDHFKNFFPSSSKELIGANDPPSL